MVDSQSNLRRQNSVAKPCLTKLTWPRSERARASMRTWRVIYLCRQRDDPALRGRPVVVAWERKRSVVCADYYEGRRFGVSSAMPAVMAERLCPDAIFVPPDFVRYKAASQAVREMFQRHTDAIKPLSLDEAYLDVSENKTGLPTAPLVTKTIRKQIWNELTHVFCYAGRRVLAPS